MTTKPTTDKQTNKWPTVFVLKQNISSLKKTGPGQTRTQELCRHRHIRYRQVKLIRNAKKFEYKIKQGRDESRKVCGQSCFRKSLVPGCNNLIYRKVSTRKTTNVKDILFFRKQSFRKLNENWKSNHQILSIRNESNMTASVIYFVLNQQTQKLFISSTDMWK